MDIPVALQAKADKLLKLSFKSMISANLHVKKPYSIWLKCKNKII
jgi:hypothetical protein